MLAHRLRPFPNIKTTLVQRLVFAGTRACSASRRHVLLMSISICIYIAEWSHSTNEYYGSGIDQCIHGDQSASAHTLSRGTYDLLKKVVFTTFIKVVFATL